MAATIEKRTADSRWFDVDCTRLLDPTETIVSITSITCDQGNLAFSSQKVNAQALTYPDGSVAAIGKVAQVRISGGVIPAGSRQLICVIRVLLATNLNPAIEATVLLRLLDIPFI
jgi:hypothetical protein